jgi:hypothetical protein
VKITQITVLYGETVGLPEYSNVKPQLTLTVTVNDGDDPAVLEADLWQHCRLAVQEQADRTLEQNDRAAKYDPAPRYQVLMTYWDRYGRPRLDVEPPKIVIILPNGIDLGRRPDIHFVSSSHADTRKLRYAHALRIAVEAAQERGYVLIDCADGDLSPLLAALPLPPEQPAPAPLSEEDAAGIREADDMEDERAEDDDDDDDGRDEDRRPNDEEG